MTSSPVGWTFLSNHGHVLVALAINPDARMRDIAAHVGITERAVQMIVRDLEEGGYVIRERVGRRNRYTVVGQSRFRHPLEEHVRVGDFLALVNWAASRGATPPRRAGASPPPAVRP
ncbi:winged helix-turn-helix domain-containing protein [Blastococcus sp. KM273129]|uniref:helix-turn-helix transcriptional regulator n=1 Tax=Blastococcus sp. KM273129 TaxID=2570315 RepID=UPI001F36D919|nr:winged helix-turn-helix domain-containing protein [Blastococcus sp. KM273129]MCF6737003.1 winged helix-turn-helix transcriptional regulator [Blastococcus sp. KM273129]